VRLLCLPYAGGGARAYAGWKFDGDIQVTPLRLPGREERLDELPYGSVDAAVEAIVSLKEVFEPLPYIIFGHSMGAIIGFELARAVRGCNCQQPLALFVSGSPGPRSQKADCRSSELTEADLVSKLRWLGGTPEIILEDKDMLEMLLLSLRADLAMIENYKYREAPLLECPIFGFCGTEDRSASRSSMQLWEHETSAEFEVQLIPGGHFFLNSARAVLLRVLAQSIAKVVSGLPGPR